MEEAKSRKPWVWVLFMNFEMFTHLHAHTLSHLHRKGLNNTYWCQQSGFLGVLEANEIGGLQETYTFTPHTLVFFDLFCS